MNCRLKGKARSDDGYSLSPSRLSELSSDPILPYVRHHVIGITIISSSFQDDPQGTTYWAFQICASTPLAVTQHTHASSFFSPSRYIKPGLHIKRKLCCGHGEQGPVPGGTERKIPYPMDWCEAGLGNILCCMPATPKGQYLLDGAQAHYLQVDSMDISQDTNTCMQPGVGGWKYCAKQGSSW
ncbi:hypothetical protein COCCADRAFT_111090 [Bipolaris zeicola 26-R-13]|uniref:Uncharacterized protein n=1 Tax=Cochliobolus carbonum (strain 26-R-13) TaxID=930089 RepID=W6Y9D3_COCC2|nr:uncharacterized protein COCCADRAFT_111090 [Bipolaris zeicola 26-R-13]EUC27661.1 hypothetical protein COCCADRAFT_111090 [Bipolaris zeicola 26-R-13]